MIKELDDTNFHLQMGAETDLLAIMHKPGVPPIYLTLKVDCIASITRNLSIEDGLVKNARVQVDRLRLATKVSKTAAVYVEYKADTDNPRTFKMLPTIAIVGQPVSV